MTMACLHLLPDPTASFGFRAADWAVSNRYLTVSLSRNLITVAAKSTVADVGGAAVLDLMFLGFAAAKGQKFRMSVDERGCAPEANNPFSCRSLLLKTSSQSFNPSTRSPRMTPVTARRTEHLAALPVDTFGCASEHTGRGSAYGQRVLLNRRMKVAAVGTCVSREIQFEKKIHYQAAVARVAQKLKLGIRTALAAEWSIIKLVAFLAVIYLDTRGRISSRSPKGPLHEASRRTADRECTKKKSKKKEEKENEEENNKHMEDTFRWKGEGDTRTLLLLKKTKKEKN